MKQAGSLSSVMDEAVLNLLGSCLGLLILSMVFIANEEIKATAKPSTGLMIA